MGIGQFQQEMTAADVNRINYDKARLELPYAAQAAASDIRYKDSLSANNEALTDLERKTQNFKVQLKALEVKESDQRVKELLATEEGRMAAHNVQKLRDDHILDFAAKDPKTFKSWVEADMRLTAAQSDAATMLIQDKKDWRVVDQIYQTMQDGGSTGGLAGVRAQAARINQEWLQNHDSPLIDPSKPLEPQIGQVMRTRNSLIGSLDYYQKLALQQADPSSALAVANFQLKLQNRADKIERENAALVQKVADKDQKQVDANLKDADKYVSDTLSSLYGQMEDRKERIMRGQGTTIFYNPDIDTAQSAVSGTVRNIIAKAGPKFDYRGYIDKAFKVIPITYKDSFGEDTEPSGTLTPAVAKQYIDTVDLAPYLPKK